MTFATPLRSFLLCMAAFTSAHGDVGATRVPAGANLQDAIDRARPGDTLVLEAGATYVGNFTLPDKTGSGRRRR